MTGSTVPLFHLSVFNRHGKARILLNFCIRIPSSLNNQIKELAHQPTAVGRLGSKQFCVVGYFFA